MRPRAFRWIVLGLFMVALGSPAYAQGTHASILGTINDASGLALPGVTVTAVNQQTGFTREALTTETGAYRLAGLPPGTYDLKATLTGFADQVLPGITLLVLQEATINFKLQLASVQETVTVTGEALVVEVSKSEVSGTVVQEQIMALPVGSRLYTDLALLLPGANADQRRDWSDPVNVGTGAWYQTAFVMDGASSMWMATGESAMNYTEDGVREFKLITSGFKPEYGNSATGVVVGISKSGTNALHGSAYEFFRNNALRSLAAFETVKQPFRRHQFGATVGGPIVRDRVHFFAAVERLDEQASKNVNTGGIYPSIDGQYVQPLTQTLGTFKVDAVISPRHSAFVRWALQRKELLLEGVGGRTDPTATRNNHYPRDSVVAGVTSVFRSAVNDFRIEFSYPRATKVPNAAGGLSYQFDNLLWGNRPGFETQWEQRLEIVDDFTYHKSGWGGEHDFKAGFAASPYNSMMAQWWYCDVGCYRIAGDQPGFPQTPVDLNKLSAAGRIIQLELGYAVPAPKTDDPLFGGYVQDDWRPLQRLTLNMGVRWDAQTNVYRSAGGKRYSGLLYIPGVYDRSTRQQRDLDNFAPRIGFAYDLSGNSRSVVRGNAGIFYGLIPGLQPYMENRDSDGENIAQLFVPSPKLTNWEQPKDDVGDPHQRTLRPNITVNDNRLPNPRSYQLGLGYSRELAAGLSLDVDAVHTKGQNELARRNLNTPDPTTRQIMSNKYLLIIQQQTTGRSEYDALMVKLNKRMRNKLQFMVSYTLAKARNMMSSPWGNPGDSNYMEREYGPTASDRRHRLVFSGITTALPWDLQLSGVLSAASDRPFDVTAARDLNGDGDTGDRPPGITRDQGCRGLNLDAVNAYRQAYSLPAVTSVACPGRTTLDIRLTKSFPLWTSGKLETFFEVYNLFNAHNLEYTQSQGVQSVSALVATFGQAILAGAPRQAVLAARFSF